MSLDDRIALHINRENTLVEMNRWPPRNGRRVGGKGEGGRAGRASFGRSSARIHLQRYINENKEKRLKKKSKDENPGPAGSTKAMSVASVSVVEKDCR
jgi:hypothetical protein